MADKKPQKITNRKVPKYELAYVYSQRLLNIIKPDRNIADDLS